MAKLMHDKQLYARLSEDYNKARTEFYQAEANFNAAEADFVDVAIAQLHAAEAKMDALLRQLKRARGEM